jgi:hypothetical protein
VKKVEAFVKLFLATKMKSAVMSTVISLAFVSQASAVLRPLFPVKTPPPVSGEVIVIEDDFLRFLSKTLLRQSTTIRTYESPHHH